MSCYIKVKTRVIDLELLAESLKEQGYAVTRRPGVDRRGDAVLQVTGQGEGRTFLFDAAQRAGQPVELLGDNQDLTVERVNAIHRTYAEKLLVREAKARGFTGIERRVVGDEVVLTVRKWVA